MEFFELLGWLTINSSSSLFKKNYEFDLESIF